MNKQVIITLAKEAAKFYLNQSTIIGVTKDMPAWLLEQKYGLFVCFIDYANNIRSQAGKIYPGQNNLGQEIIAQTIKCVNGNNIFKPITKSELSGLKLAIYIILKQEQIFNLNLLQTGQDGILVINNNNKLGYALPQKIPNVELLKIACRHGKIDYQNDNYKIFRLIIKSFLE